MQNSKPVSYLLDFDSTFIQSEGLDELAALSLEGNPEREKILAEIQQLTKLGMEGKMPFEESLRKRITLLQSNKTFIQAAADILKKKISPSILRNKKFFQQHKENIYIISGGFKELILPIAALFSIAPDHVFANTFIYDAEGNIIGLDENNLMSKNQGKVEVVKSLKLSNDVYIIGDGYTDYELRMLGLADKFIAFTENIERKLVIKHADEIAPNFDEFLFENNLPRSLSYPKNRISVLIQADIPDEDLQLFTNEGYQIVRDIRDFDITNTSILCLDETSQQLIERATKPLAVGFYAGTPTFDKAKAKGKGIAVFHKNAVAQRIIAYVNSGSTSQCATIPNLHLTQYKNSHRLLHIHKNVPGILAQINNIMADHKSNILAQYLKTDPTIGYAIIDIDKEYDREVLASLKKIQHTIRFRVLY